jgi:hypothetical protein
LPSSLTVENRKRIKGASGLIRRSEENSVIPAKSSIRGSLEGWASTHISSTLACTPKM